MPKKESDVVSAEDISSLNQLIKNSEDSFANMEKAYKKKDADGFNKAKATLIQTQKLISEKIK